MCTAELICAQQLSTAGSVKLWTGPRRSEHKRVKSSSLPEELRSSAVGAVNSEWKPVTAYDKRRW